jgi:hypothetical protein
LSIQRPNSPPPSQQQQKQLPHKNRDATQEERNISQKRSPTREEGHHMRKRGPEEYSTAWGNRSPVLDAATAAPASPAPSFPAAPSTCHSCHSCHPKRTCPHRLGCQQWDNGRQWTRAARSRSSATTASSDTMIMAQAEEALKALQMMGIADEVNCRIRQAVNG